LHTVGEQPLLTDENIFYRLMKMAYGESYAAYDVRGFLRNFPLMYGVWHAYKAAVLRTYQTFFPLCIFLRLGTLPPGNTVSTHAKLNTIEQLVAGLWVKGSELLGAIDQAIHTFGVFSASQSSSRANAVQRPVQGELAPTEAHLIPGQQMMTQLYFLWQLRINPPPNKSTGAQLEDARSTGPGVRFYLAPAQLEGPRFY
jgi:hypothetical protein